MILISITILVLLTVLLTGAHPVDFETQEERLSSAELGILELSKSLQNPKALNEALDSLKDPEVMAEVQALMKDKQFQEEMKAILDSPRYKAAVARAQVNFESILEDPKASQEILGLLSKGRDEH